VAVRVEEALRQVGLDPARFSDRSPFELSGGEKRRVAIAGVLAMRPEVLVLDEPTAGLDPKGREELLALVAGLHRGGMTIVLISHDMDVVAALARRVVVLGEGRIRFEGGPRDVFARDAELRAIGFTAPQATRLARMLRERGVPLDDVLTIGEARQALKALVGGVGRGTH
jgi:energy-coupling factor transport system ATP-binding protein